MATGENILDPTRPYYDLGTLSRTVTTDREAQTWFDRGLTWGFAFNFDEAVKCYEQALVHDPAMIMGYWGIAYSSGPNYNMKWEYVMPQLDSKMQVIQKSLKAASGHLHPNTPPVERALLEALHARYPEDYGDKEFGKWNLAYAEAMQGVYEAFPDDLDVAMIYADSLMEITPWNLWNIKTGEPSPGSRAIDARRVLEKAFETEKGHTHPGLLHLYLHLTEMSTTPEKAVPVADRLRGLIPQAGHLNHMPSHIDVLVGDYRQVISSNMRAVDNDYVHLERLPPDTFYSVHILHCLDMIVYGAMFNGQSKIAIDNALLLEQTVTEGLMTKFGFAVDAMKAIILHVYIRFGKWEDILAWDMKYDPTVYPYTVAIWHYARGIARAATGKVEAAIEEREQMMQAIAKIPPHFMVFPNSASDVIQIGVAMLDGEIAYRQGDFDAAFEHLRTSIKRYDTIGYGEPWGWMQPVRHAYAALQLERGNVQEAMDTYAADLGYNDSLARAHQHPNNVWALHGYHECLQILGKHELANIVKPHLTLALAIADIKVESSCFCRQETLGNDVVAAGKAKCCD